MLKVTSLQCRRARGLLGWNQRDLTHKSGVQSHRINSFERGLLHLRQDENKGLYHAFKEEGIVFREYGEVSLNKHNAGTPNNDGTQSQAGGGQKQEAERIIINDEEYLRLTGGRAMPLRPSSGRFMQQEEESSEASAR